MNDTAMTSGDRPDIRLPRSWILLFALVLLCIVAGGYWGFRVYEQGVRSTQYQQLKAIGELKANQIVEWREERRDDVTCQAESPLFINAVNAWMEDSGNLTQRDTLFQHLRLLQKTYGYDDALLLDPDQRILLAIQDALSPMDASTMKAIAAALVGRQAILSDLFRSPKGVVYFDTVAPVPNADGRPIAVLVLRQNAEHFLYPLIQSWPSLSPSAETVLVRKEGDQVLFLNKLRHYPDAPLFSFRIPLTWRNNPAVQAVLGNQAIYEGQDYRGAKVLADLRPIPDSPWFMVTKVDTSEILAEVRTHALIVTLFTALFILLATTGVAYAYRNRQTHLYRILYNSEMENRRNMEERHVLERSLRRGEDRFRLLLDSTGEAIYGIDMDGNCTFCNPACLQLLGYTAPEDLLGNNMHWKIHHRHADGSPYPIEESPIFEAFKKGIRRHQEDEVFWRADGSCFPVEYWSYPKSYENEITGAVVTFVDISERRQRIGAMETALWMRQNMGHRSKQDLIDYALEQAVVLTQSTDGYFHYVNADQKTVRLLTWSQHTRQVCTVPDLNGHYPIEQAGVWVDCVQERRAVVHNDYASLPHKKGLPEGHLPLWRDVGIPIVSSDRIMAILGVGNKAQDYSASDVSALTLIGETLGAALFLQEAQEALQVSHRAALNLLQDAQIQKHRAEAALERAKTAEQESIQRAQWAEGLQKAGQQLSACLTIDAIAELAVQVPVDYLQMKMAWLTCPQKGGGTYTAACSDPEIAPISNDTPCVREVFAKKVVVLRPDTAAGPGYGAEYLNHAGKQMFKNCGSFPIIAGEECVAVLTICDMGTGQGCRMASASPLIEIFCHQVGHVWQRRLNEEEKYKLVCAVEESPAIVVITDRSAVIEYVNRKFVEVTGYTRQEAQGQNPRIFQSGQHSPEFYQGMWQTLNAGREWRGDLCNRKKNGDLYWEHAAISPIRSTRGIVTHFVAMKEDITESKALLEKLVRSQAEAEKANLAKSVFLANMSHEIRTPMNAILGYCQLLQRDKGLTAQQTEYLQIISWSGDHLLAIINDILEMSKIEAGRITLNPTVFELSAMLKDIEMMFRVRLETKRKLVLEINRSGELPKYICADEGKVRQVLINLLSNAVKFTAEGGIAVRIRAQDQEGDGLRMAIEVEDTGCGIGADDLERVFMAFEQVRGIGNIAGTGLGLPISRRYARMMGGDLTANSILGKGSIFRFEFQAVGGRETNLLKLQIQERVMVLTPGQKEFRILVVDDRLENRLFLVRLLTTVGFLTLEAQNGAEAVAAFQEWHPHSILMDMLMPGMDGREAVRLIKAMPGGRQTAVLMVSASAMEEDRASALASGADGFLHKPFREYELFEALQRFTGVQYVYEERQAGAQKTKAVASARFLSREDIQALPQDMVKAMYSAVSAARMDDFLKWIERAREDHPKVSDGLHALAEQFHYDALLELLDPGPS